MTKIILFLVVAILWQIVQRLQIHPFFRQSKPGQISPVRPEENKQITVLEDTRSFKQQERSPPLLKDEYRNIKQKKEELIQNKISTKPYRKTTTELITEPTKQPVNDFIKDTKPCNNIDVQTLVVSSAILNPVWKNSF